MRVLISGIGRSGTTMMYQQIGRMMRDAFEATRYRYEPYLWNLNVPYAREASFGQGDLSAFGMYAHQATPLFLSGNHPTHDQFLKLVFGSEATLSNDPADPDSWLVKIIRGNGRLEAYLRTFPDLKVVICLRNPIDTLNSSLGMFSFTGEEFHRSDAPRLLDEVGQRLPHISLPASDSMTALSVSLVWWRAFTEWAMAVAAAFPGRCHLFAHEMMAIDREAEIDRLARFLAFSTSEVYKSGIDDPAGRTTSSRHLLASDMAELVPHLTYYLATCLKDLSVTKRRDLHLRLLQRYAERPFSPQLAGDALGRRTSMQLRNTMHSSETRLIRYVPPQATDPLRIPLEHRTNQYAASIGARLGALRTYAPPRLSRKGRLTFGCCVVSRNNRETIRDAIFSALDQTMPFDKIVVVDDASTDGTQKLLEELGERYARLDVHYRNESGGKSTAQNEALGLLGTDFVTTLGGTDCFWPTKSREEAEVCLDDPSAVAFSPTARDYSDDRWIVANASRFSGSAGALRGKILAREDGMPLGITLRADTCLGVGGYDPLLSRHEDWDFMLRLASAPHNWKMSGSHVGTISNQRQPLRPRAGIIEDTRALTHVFLKAALRFPELSGLLPLYASATKPHHDIVNTTTARLLALCDRGVLAIEALSPLLQDDLVAVPDGVYVEHLTSLAKRLGAGDFEDATVGSAR